MSSDRRSSRSASRLATLLLSSCVLTAGAAAAQQPVDPQPTPAQEREGQRDEREDEQPEAFSPAVQQPAPVPEQERPEADARGSFEFDLDRDRDYVATALSISGGRDSGFVAGGEELDDDVYLVRPSLLVDRRPSDRTSFLFAYEPEAQFFDRYTELDAIEHAAGLLFQRDTARRSRFSFGGSFLDGEDPGRKLDAVLLVLPRTPYRQWRAWAGYERRWQRTTALFTLTHTDTRIEAAPGLFAAGVDQSEDTAAMTLTRSLSRRLDFIASYSYSDPSSSFSDFEIGEPRPIDEPLQTLTLGFIRHLQPTLSLYVSGGAVETDGEVSALAALELVRTGRDLNLRLRYDLSLLSLGLSQTGGSSSPGQTPILDTAFPDSTAHTLAFDLETRPADRLRWIQFLRGSYADLPGDASVESFSIASRLVVEALPRFAPFLQGELLDQSGSSRFGDSYSRYRVTFGFLIGLSGPPDTTGVRGRSRSINRVLPTGRVY